MEEEEVEMVEAYSHADLVKEFECSNIGLVKARKLVCTSDEYWKDPGDGKTYYTPGAVKRLRVHFEEPDILLPHFVTMYVNEIPKNPRWVICKSNHSKEAKGRKLPVAIPRKLQGKLLGKNIRVEVIRDSEGKESYRHEQLSR